MSPRSYIDLIKGLRSSKGSESQYISDAVLEIKEELKGTPQAKVNALRKLLYLQMFGCSMSFASFPAVEIVALPTFGSKRIGYLSIAQSFTDETDATIMATNQFKKDIGHKEECIAATAMASLACMTTPELSRELFNDVVTLLNSSKAVIRKKALLLAYRMLLRYPDALKIALPRIKDRLEDKDACVQASAVNIITELVIRNPSIYIAFAPTLYKLLTQPPPHDNWMLIKLVKCFGALSTVEPRLTQRLADPLINLLDSTNAQSLAFEIIQSIVIGMTHDDRLLRVAAQKLSSFVQDSDLNLQYLGLRGLASLLPAHHQVVRHHDEIVMKCLENADVSLRLRALDIVKGLATERNIKSLVKRLLLLLESESLVDIDISGSLKSALVKTIISMSTNNDYSNVTDFEWLVGVYTRLTVTAPSEALVVGSALTSIVARIPDVRELAVSKLVQAVLSPRGKQLLENSVNATTVGFIIGEFFDLFMNDAGVVIPKFLDPEIISRLSGSAVGTLVDAVVQMVLAHSTVAAENLDENSVELFSTLRLLAIEKLNQIIPIVSSFEATSRISLALTMLKTSSNPKILSMLTGLYRKSEELAPISSKAQKKIAPPDSVDLNSWIDPHVEKLVTAPVVAIKDDVFDRIPVHSLSDEDLPPLSDNKKKLKKKKKKVKTVQDDVISPVISEPKQSTPVEKVVKRSTPISIIKVKPLSDEDVSDSEVKGTGLHSALASVKLDEDFGLYGHEEVVQSEKKKKRRVKKVST
ncbi:hypothetical protein RCL1_003764 [Eukaryota sp. TZLM3-RCL]